MFTPLKIALILAATCLPGLRAQVNEYQVKAFFLYNFARYVEWPAQSFKSPTDPIVICILGPNPFGGALDHAVAGREVEGRTFVIRQIADFHSGDNCRILFVNASARKRFHSIEANLRGAGILTVGETQWFADEGGVINFKLEEGKVRFEINPQAAEREHLRISSKLLSLAAVAAKNREKQ